MTEVAMVLLNNSSLGGTERRFALVYAGLRRRNLAISLVINESLLSGLMTAGLLPPDCAPDLVLKERAGTMARRLLGRFAGGHAFEARGAMLSRSLAAIAFWLRKLDYAFGCLRIGAWLLRRRPKVLHLVLGGAYVALPLQMLGLAPASVVSVVCPSLREMVGSRLGLRLYRRALRHASVVDALTEEVRDGLHREGVPSERIRVSVGSCVDTTRFVSATARQPWVVFAGRLIPEKNPLLFVGACAQVHERVPTARFFVLGDGPLRPQVMGRLEREGLAGCTETGWRDRLEDILGQSLIFVSLQRMDNYPSQALLEAMACGNAVVATDVGLTRKLVDPSVGILVPADPTAVAEAVANLLENQAQAIAMGQRGRARVLESHSLEAYLNYVVSLYVAACRGRAGKIRVGLLGTADGAGR